MDGSFVPRYVSLFVFRVDLHDMFYVYPVWGQRLVALAFASSSCWFSRPPIHHPHHCCPLLNRSDSNRNDLMQEEKGNSKELEHRGNKATRQMTQVNINVHENEDLTLSFFILSNGSLSSDTDCLMFTFLFLLRGD